MRTLTPKHTSHNAYATLKAKLSRIPKKIEVVTPAPIQCKHAPKYPDAQKLAYAHDEALEELDAESVVDWTAYFTLNADQSP